MRMTIGKLLAVIALFIVLSTGTGFCFGVNYGWATVEPQIQVIEKEVPVEVERFVVKLLPVEVEKIVEKEVPVYVDRIVTENVTVIKSVFIPVALKDFESLEELRAVIGEEGTYVVIGSDNNSSCVASALALQNMAALRGYRIDFQIISPTTYNVLFHKYQLPYINSYFTHAINLVIIGRNIYLIEPQTREVVIGGYTY